METKVPLPSWYIRLQDGLRRDEGIANDMAAQIDLWAHEVQENQSQLVATHDQVHQSELDEIARLNHELDRQKELEDLQIEGIAAILSSGGRKMAKKAAQINTTQGENEMLRRIRQEKKQLQATIWELSQKKKYPS
mmetsp:Transcript_28179/g.55424  ORF Transcript_28179/g.55424 Transcript_28179/m.55424 type:complete len:136 (-) Transcript_28179:882-1289(-)